MSYVVARSLDLFINAGLRLLTVLVLFVDFLLVTVATNQTDGFKRFIRSAKVYNIPVKVRCPLHSEGFCLTPGVTLRLLICQNCSQMIHLCDG